jgi:hypothetical protein
MVWNTFIRSVSPTVRATALFTTQNLLHPRQAAERWGSLHVKPLRDELSLGKKIVTPTPTLGSSMAKPRGWQSIVPTYPRSTWLNLGEANSRRKEDGEFSKGGESPRVTRHPGIPCLSARALRPKREGFSEILKIRVYNRVPTCLYTLGSVTVTSNQSHDRNTLPREY